MNVVSLFDGISCGRVALDRAGISVDRYVAYEIDKYSMQVSKANWSDIEHFGDVATADFMQYKGFDLVIGGSPCQGFSSAGQGLNFDDPRSKLFFEFVRALKEIQPKYFLLENVCMKKEWQDTITEQVGANPIKINSNLITPMRRNRTYWTNIPVNELNRNRTTDLIDILDDSYDECLVLPQSTMQRLTYQIGDDLFIKNLAEKEMEVSVGDGVILSRTWSVRQPVIAKESHAIRAMNPNDIGVCIDRNGEKVFRRFTVEEMERMQTLPIGYTNCGISDSKRKKGIGNGWTVDVIAHILKSIAQ